MPTSRLSAALSLLLAVELAPVLGLLAFLSLLLGPEGFFGTWSREAGHEAAGSFLALGVSAAAWCLAFFAARSAGAARHLGVVVSTVGVVLSVLGVARVVHELYSSVHANSPDTGGAARGSLLSALLPWLVWDAVALAAAVGLRSRVGIVRSAAVATLTIAGCAGVVFFLFSGSFDHFSSKFWLLSLPLVLIPFTALGLVLSEDAAPRHPSTDDRA